MGCSDDNSRTAKQPADIDQGAAEIVFYNLIKAIKPPTYEEALQEAGKCVPVLMFP